MAPDLGALLRACLRLEGPGDAADAVRRLSPEEAEALVTLAVQEGVAPLLRAALRGVELPAPMPERLDRLYWATAARNARLLQALRAILDRLSAQNIPVMVLKGAALAEPLYGNIALRPMGDLDLLLHREGVPRAVAVLDGMGYHAVHAEPRPGAHLAHEVELMLCQADNPDLLVELHWSLFDAAFYRERLPMDWFWQTAIDAQVAGMPCRVLGHAAQVLHLCGHAMLHHQGERLLWGIDIARYLARYGEALDAELLAEMAHRCCLILPLCTCLSRLEQDGLAHISNPLRAQLESLTPSPRERRVYRTLTSGDERIAARMASELRDAASWRARAAYLRDHLLPSRAYMRARYNLRHDLLLPCYYVYRWLRALRRR